MAVFEQDVGASDVATPVRAVLFGGVLKIFIEDADERRNA